MDEDPNEPSLCNGCTKFTHRNLLFLRPDRGDQLGDCRQEDGNHKYVTHKTTCPRYSPPTRFERILRGIVGAI